MDIFLVYLWSIWDNFNWVSTILFAGLFLLAIILLYTYVDIEYESDYNENNNTYEAKRFKKVLSFSKKYFIIVISFSLINSFIPDKNKMVLIISTPYIVKTAKDNNLTALPIKLIKTLNKSLNYVNKVIDNKK